MQSSLKGAKGGGGSDEKFVQKPDNLRSKDTFEGLLGLTIGPIKGPVDGMNSVRINGTPVEDIDGDENYPDFQFVLADGDPMAHPQRPKLRLGAAGSPQAINTQLRNTSGTGDWSVHTMTSTDADAIDLRFIVQQLYEQDEKGIRGTTANIEIEMKPTGTTTWINPFAGATANGGTYDKGGTPLDDSVQSGLVHFMTRSNYQRSTTSTSSLKITGKTTSPYVKELRVLVPNEGEYAGKTWDIRARLVQKESVDNDPDFEKRTIQFESIAAVYTDRLGGSEEWRGVSWMQLYGVASDKFNGVPEVDSDLDLKIVKVPPASVYDAENRVYTGATWDGSWNSSWTTDPAWIINDVISDALAGLSTFAPGSSLNKWDALELSKWASEQVDDGAGGTHPRYSMHLYAQKPQKAEDYVRYLAGAVGATAWDDGGGAWRVRVDKPETPVALFTLESIEGEFNYSHTDIDTRFNEVTVIFQNEEFNYREDQVVLENDPHIAKYGRKPTKVVAIGCTNRQQALRWGVLRLRTNCNETRAVSFTTNRFGRHLERFDHILIADGSLNHLDGSNVRSTGRMIGHDDVSIQLRDSLRLEAGVAYQLHITVENPDYDPNVTSEPTTETWDQPTITIVRDITNGAGQIGDVKTLYIDAPLPANVAENAHVALEAVGLPALPKTYRVLDVIYNDDGERITINAMEIDTGKWAASDAATDGDITHLLYDQAPPPPAAPAQGVFALDVFKSQFGEHRILTASWERPDSIYLDRYRIEYRFNEGTWQDMGYQRELAYEIPSPMFGIHEVRVYGVSHAGKEGRPLTASFEVVEQLPLIGYGADNLLQPIEKTSLVKEWNVISAEKPDIIAKADDLGVSTVAYENEFNDISAYLASLDPAWNDTSQETVISRTTWTDNWRDFYVARTQLLNAIAKAAGLVAEWSGVTGEGKPEDNATYGADLGSNVTGVLPNAKISGDMTSLVKNPNFSTGDLTNWRKHSGGAAISVIPCSDQSRAGYACRLGAGTGGESVAMWSSAEAWSSPDADKDGFVVAPGEKFFVSIDIMRTANYDGSVYVRLYFLMSDGTYNTLENALSLAAGNIPTAYDTLIGDVTAPAGAVRAWGYIRSTGATAGAVEFTNFNIYRKVSLANGVDGNLDDLPDGDFFAKIGKPWLSNSKPIVDLADDIHINKRLNYLDGNLDDVADGLNYKKYSYGNDLKLGNIEDNATAGADWGSNVSGRPDALKNLNGGYIKDDYIKSSSDGSLLKNRWPAQAGATANSSDSFLLDFNNGIGRIKSNQMIYAPSANLIPNHNFATGDMSEWRLYAGEGDVTVEPSVDKTVAPYVCRMQANAGLRRSVFSGERAYNLSGNYKEGFAPDPGKSYIWKMHARRSSSWDGAFKIYYYYLDTDGSYQNSDYLKTHALTTSLTEYEVSFTPPADAVRIWIYIVADDATAGFCEFTNVIVKEQTRFNEVKNTPANLTALSGAEQIKNNSIVFNTDGSLVTDDGSGPINLGALNIDHVAEGSNNRFMTPVEKTKVGLMPTGEEWVCQFDYGGVENPKSFWDEWTDVQGQGPNMAFYVNNSDVPNGTYMHIGNNTGNDELWAEWKTNIPYDNTAVYEFEIMIRRTGGSGSIYAGFNGIHFDGSTRVNVSGSDSISSQHYAIIESPGADWTIYRGYFGGRGSGGDRSDMQNPMRANASVRFFRPMMILNYPDAAGAVSVAMFRIRKLVPFDQTPGQIPDATRIKPITSAGVQYTWANQTIDFDGNGSSATINVTAATLRLGSKNISYSAMSKNVTSTGYYYLYIVDEKFDGGSQTLQATTNPDVLGQNSGYIYVGGCDVTSLSSGATGGGSGGGFCLDAEAKVLTLDGYKRACEIRRGDWLWALNETRDGGEWLQCRGNVAGTEDCFTITDTDGNALTLSASTPLMIEGGNYITAVYLDGHKLPIEIDGVVEWHPFTKTYAQTRTVAKIDLGDRIFAAGDEEGVLIFTHNAANKPEGGL